MALLIFQCWFRPLHVVRAELSAVVALQRPDGARRRRGRRGLLQALHIVLHPARAGAAGLVT